ncbi:hypothetical protein DFH28DRAFT_333664 [Melampsora americana]|nr:hypothetical protein DFH28DRAFT_333664 [Melampsora americana]
MSYREARDARLRSMNEIRSSGMEIRGDSIEDQERVRSEKNLKQDEKIRGRLRRIGIITPMMNKSLMKTIILCGNVEDFLEIDQTSSGLIRPLFKK